jgi:hypothetical protein
MEVFQIQIILTEFFSMVNFSSCSIKYLHQHRFGEYRQLNKTIGRVRINGNFFINSTTD